MSEGAIFRSVQQALHVSFLIMSEPAREKAALRLTLIKIMSEQGTLGPRATAWLEQLIGAKSGTVNFEGLGPLEVRAQAAMVVAAVRHHLRPAESKAILVHYGRGVEKKQAVIWTSQRLRASLGLPSTEAVRFLVAEQSLSKAERDTVKSFKFISDQTSVPIRTLERAANAIRRDLRVRENAAYDTLSPMFIRDGLIES